MRLCANNFCHKSTDLQPLSRSSFSLNTFSSKRNGGPALNHRLGKEAGRRQHISQRRWRSDFHTSCENPNDHKIYHSWNFIRISKRISRYAPKNIPHVQLRESHFHYLDNLQSSACSLWISWRLTRWSWGELDLWSMSGKRARKSMRILS